MNVITILIDSLNAHCLEPYGASHVRTPNVQRFAGKAAVFDSHFAGSMPCMPARRELFTGRQEFLWRGWGGVEPWDRHLAKVASDCGAVTQMITDHYHYWEGSARGYFEPFHGMEFIRGPECDMASTRPTGEIPPWVERINTFRPGNLRQRQGLGSIYWANCRDWKSDRDWSGPRVMTQTASWLRQNASHPKFFLWAESFDPHEPFYVPEPYRSMYVNKPAAGPFNCWPPYQDLTEQARFLEAATDQEIGWIRAQYFGKVTMVDRWLGEVFDAMDELGLWETTAVVLTTDHGHDLCWARDLFPYAWGKQFPHPESHARTPLMIWHPEHPGRGRRIDALTSAVDVNATIRDILGAEDHDGPHGKSLMPLVSGESSHHRDWVLYGTFAEGATLSTSQWTLAQGSVPTEQMFWYSSISGRVSSDMSCGCFVPGVDIPQWKVPVKPSEATRASANYLWDRSVFDLRPHNLITERPEEARRMRVLMRQALEEVGCPPETFRRLGL